MFKIGDFSRLGQVSVRMLRHYDKLGLLKPSHTDRFTGYRYYTIDQLARLHRIVALNGIGLTLQQITTLLDEKGDLPLDQLRGMLMVRQAEIEQELNERQSQLTSVAARLAQLEHEGQPSPYEIVVKSVEPLTVAGIRSVAPSLAQMGEYCQMLYEQLYAGLARHGIAFNGTELTLYYNEEYTEHNVDIETVLPVSPDLLRRGALDTLTFHELPPAPLSASLIYEGSYSDVTAAVLALLAWTGQHNHVIAGPLRELHLSGPAHVNGQLQEPAILELQVPIQPTSNPA